VGAGTRENSAERIIAVPVVEPKPPALPLLPNRPPPVLVLLVAPNVFVLEFAPKARWEEARSQRVWLGSVGQVRLKEMLHTRCVVVRI
jgi:hypothetical protein